MEFDKFFSNWWVVVSVRKGGGAGEICIGREAEFNSFQG